MFIGIFFGLAAWFLVTCLIGGIYTVNQNERAVKTSFGRAERIPGATLTQLIGGDHYIMEERPGEVTAALLELLARPSVVSRGLKPSDLD